MQASLFFTTHLASLKKLMRHAFFYGLICSLSFAYPKVVIFDLGNVLFQTSRWGMGREIGIWDLALHKLGGGNIKAAGFKFLEDAFGAQAPINPLDPESAWLYIMGDGIHLPQIWCDNMKGLISGEELVQKAYNCIDDHSASARERRLIKKFLNSIFNPAILAQHTYPIPAGTQIVADCAACEENDIMILSNYAADAFAELYKKPESNCIFKHVAPENLIVSGNIGLAKPDPAIYEYVKAKLIALDARFEDPYFLSQNCVFIDDQIENVINARQAGITTLDLSDGDYNKLRHELEQLDVL